MFNADSIEIFKSLGLATFYLSLVKRGSLFHPCCRKNGLHHVSCFFMHSAWIGDLFCVSVYPLMFIGVQWRFVFFCRNAIPASPVSINKTQI